MKFLLLVPVNSAL